MYLQNRVLRAVGLRTLRTASRAVFWLGPPRLLVNSMPKAGTHLLTAVLARLPRTVLAYDFLRTQEVSVEGAAGSAARVDPARLARRLSRLQGGHVATAHLPYSPAVCEVLSSLGVQAYFLLRDPGDIVVSRMFYVAGLKRHRLHHSLVDRYRDQDERLMACIRGFDGPDGGPGMASIGTTWRSMSPWAGLPGVCVVRFEPLVGAEGDAAQLAALRVIAQHANREVSDAALQSIRDAAIGRRTATLRKGVAGDWRNHLTDSHLAALADELGPGFSYPGGLTG